jgi:thiol-disulfide isomerase/thioredoxin
MKRLILLLPLCLLAAGCPEPSRTREEPPQPAPPLEGVNLDGKPIKLSDFRGKVVVVDFWGPWCGPCVQAIPHERAMANRFKDKPFTFLSVANCHDRQELVDFLATTTLPWPNIFEILPGPNAKKWKVDGYPTFVVVDADGLIRHRSYGGPEVELTVVNLLEKLEKKTN